MSHPHPPNNPVRRTDLAGMRGPEQSVAPGAEYFVGVDLAWGQRGTTGLAVLDDTGSLLDVTTRQTDDDILGWLRPWAVGPCFVAFDAPIIVVNPSGHRLCERLSAATSAATARPAMPPTPRTPASPTAPEPSAWQTP
ncbi:hypothetical protein ACFPJ1_01895 [Kribbella qitaiheensis]|uniref:hypothetical protein n=1 Tax=Kribbella qitaiheensis TaxID=1544730 RepID=UPI003622A809